MDSNEFKANPFGALAAAATHDPKAAGGLALAYESMHRNARKGLIAAIVNDAREEGFEAAPALAALLSVEEDLEVAGAIVQAMDEAGTASLSPTNEQVAKISGDEVEGAALLANPLYSDFVELAVVAWNDTGVTRTVLEPMITSGDVNRHARLFESEQPLTTVNPSVAVHRIVTALWKHRRRHGGMPSGLERLAPFLT